MVDHRSESDLSASPPRLAFPRIYNAAADLVDRQLEAGNGARIAYRDDRGRMTYAELHERACRAGNALASLGVEPEQRVMLVMLDTVDFPAVFLGAMRLGAVPVPVNTMLTSEDYAFMLRDSRAKVVVVSDTLLPKLEPALSKLEKRPHLIVASSPQGGDRGTYDSLDDLCERASVSLAPAATTRDDVAFWLYSSGSTGRPKGAVHLHSHLMITAVRYAQAVLGIQPDDVVFSAAKLFFAYGLGNSLTFPLAVGASAVLTADRPTPAVVGRVMRDERPSIFCGVPTLFASLLANAQFVASKGSSALRVSTSAGEALPKHVGEGWQTTMGSDILDGIGSTEMLHIFISNRPGEVRYGTTGKPVPGYDLKLLADDGEPVADGEEGTLWVKGASSAAYYWSNREQSLATFHGAWTRTGDRYVRDADGYYTYSGRADDMLKVGGIWVSPFEVESALSANDAVLEAAVVGHADADGLVKPKAFVVLKDPAKASDAFARELQAFVKERLAPYKYPRWIRVLAGAPEDGDRQDPALQAAWLSVSQRYARSRTDRELKAGVRVLRALARRVDEGAARGDVDDDDGQLILHYPIAVPLGGIEVEHCHLGVDVNRQRASGAPAIGRAFGPRRLPLIVRRLGAAPTPVCTGGVGRVLSLGPVVPQRKGLEGPGGGEAANAVALAVEITRQRQRHGLHFSTRQGGRLASAQVESQDPVPSADITVPEAPIADRAVATARDDRRVCAERHDALGTSGCVRIAAIRGRAASRPATAAAGYGPRSARRRRANSTRARRAGAAAAGRAGARSTAVRACVGLLVLGRVDTQDPVARPEAEREQSQSCAPHGEPTLAERRPCCKRELRTRPRRTHRRPPVPPLERARRVRGARPPGSSAGRRPDTA